MVQMFDIQTIFTVIYSILYGIMLNSCGGLNLFHFGWLFRNNLDRNIQQRVGRRIFISMIFINFLPFVFFSIFYLWLGNPDINDNIKNISFPEPILNIIVIICISMMSQIVFSFYRLIHVFIKYRLIFDERLYELDTIDFDCDRFQSIGLNDFCKRYKNMGPNNAGQLFASFFYLVLPIIGILLLQNITNSFQLGKIIVIGIATIFLIHYIGELFCEPQRKLLFEILILFSVSIIFYLTLQYKLFLFSVLIELFGYILYLILPRFT